ncbi:MAG: alpha/beta hydrolase-fold protein [Pseudomonadota bacterium]
MSHIFGDDVKNLAMAFLIVTSACFVASCGGGGGSGSVNGGGSTFTDLKARDATFSAEAVLDTWLMKVDAHGDNFNFYLYTPENYTTAGNTAYPVVIVLHGDDGSTAVSPQLTPQLLRQGPLAPLAVSDTKLDAAARPALNSHIRNAFVIYPKIPKVERNGLSDPLGYWNPNAINKIVDYVSQNYRIDKQRLYVTGLSLGSWGTFHYARTNPDKVAAIAPISAGLEQMWGGAQLKGMPIWLFHSFNDPVVSLNSAIVPSLATLTAGVDFMQAYPHRDGNKQLPAPGDYTVSYSDQAGRGPWNLGSSNASGVINFTLYAGGGHNAWDRTYANSAMWDWMFSKVNTRLQ